MSSPSQDVPSPSQDAVADRLRSALNVLENVPSPSTIDDYLAPWRSESIPGDSRRCTLARYLQWTLSLPGGVSVDHHHAQVAGHPWVQLPASVAEFQVRDSIVPGDSPGPGTEAAKATTVSRLGAILKELDDLGSPEAIAAHLEPWRVGSVPGDTRSNALARYLQWKLSIPDGVSVDHRYAQMSGLPWVTLPATVAIYQRTAGDVAPGHAESTPPGEVFDAEEFRARVEAAKRKDANGGLVALGVLLAISGVIVLLAPFISLGGSTGASTVNLFSANGICGSTLGQLAQGVSTLATQECGNISLGFFGSWAAIVVGAGLLLTGLLRR